MIVFIGCVKSKRNKPCEAQYMYTSTLFNYSLSYAKRLTTNDKIYILSAKYGVLRLNDIIRPYNLCLNDKSEKNKKVWSEYCYSQMVRMSFNFNEKTIFLCGDNYRKYIKNYFKNYSIPLEGLSLGNQLKFYKKRKF